MTASVSSIDDILIGVFLTASLLFIIIWSIMLLKWRKKYLYKIFPCVPNRTNAARIKKQERLNHRTEIMNINEANNARRFSNDNNNNNNTVNTTINTTSTTNTNTNTAKSSEILTAANTIISTETTLTTPTKQEDSKQPIKPSPSVITIGERSGEVELEHETISYDRDNPFVDTVTEITEKKRKSSEIDSQPVITITSSSRNNNYQLSSHYPLSSSSSSSSSSNSGEFDTTNLKGNGKDANNISSDDNPFEDGRNPFEYLNQREYDDGAELDVDEVKPELQSRF